jgi:hypothetical protein
MNGCSGIVQGLDQRDCMFDFFGALDGGLVIDAEWADAGASIFKRTAAPTSIPGHHAFITVGVVLLKTQGVNKRRENGSSSRFSAVWGRGVSVAGR